VWLFLFVALTENLVFSFQTFDISRWWFLCNLFGLAFFPGLLLFFHFSSQNFAKRRHTTDDLVFTK